MSADNEIRVVPSILDRLLDQDPRSHRDVPSSRVESIREFRRAVQRDLDDLLNSRNAFADLLPEFAEAGQSVLTYGLPDLSAYNLSDGRDQNRVRQIMEAVIRTFEPRLKNVVVTVLAPGLVDRVVRFHVEARLVMEPSPQTIGFDIQMPVDSRTCEVK